MCTLSDCSEQSWFIIHVMMNVTWRWSRTWTVRRRGAGDTEQRCGLSSSSELDLSHGNPSPGSEPDIGTQRQKNSRDQILMQAFLNYRLFVNSCRHSFVSSVRFIRLDDTFIRIIFRTWVDTVTWRRQESPSSRHQGSGVDFLSDLRSLKTGLWLDLHSHLMDTEEEKIYYWLLLLFKWFNIVF